MLDDAARHRLGIDFGNAVTGIIPVNVVGASATTSRTIG